MQEGVQATRFSQHALAKHPSQQQHKPISHVMPLEQSAAQSSWVPVALSAIVKDGMVTFRHAGHPWVLFRQANGAPAAIEDCCAHRACPLSLVFHSSIRGCKLTSISVLEPRLNMETPCRGKWFMGKSCVPIMAGSTMPGAIARKCPPP